MKKTILLVIIAFYSAVSFAQEDTTYWKKSGATSLTFGQTSFSNWAAGGENSVSVLGAFSANMNYEKSKWTWDNSVDLGYGLSYQGSDQIKNDDRIILATRVGYKASKLWSYAAEVSFKSQFYKGYSSYPVEDGEYYISKFMAPGYVYGSLGMNYTHPTEDLKILLSPVTEKMTFVLDDSLSNQGAYGVDPGKKVFAEFGSMAKATYSKKFAENILFKSTLSLFTAYESFGNVDVDWANSLDWKLNKYFTLKVDLFLLYDNDIKNVDKDGNPEGAKVQLKEVLGFGFGYIF
ncbi:MAG: DUF3078 domain-containing protein [Tannerella sp.]|jgi:hypothetical protein|nr:DUF3078 domain-containing protein [Tannerella sp.]